MELNIMKVAISFIILGIVLVSMTILFQACQPMVLAGPIATPTPLETTTPTPSATTMPYVAPQLDYDKMLNDIGNDNLNKMAVI
jgi:hypothetical protein